MIEDKIKAQKPEQCAVLIYTVSAAEEVVTSLLISYDNYLCSLGQLEILKVL